MIINTCNISRTENFLSVKTKIPDIFEIFCCMSFIFPLYFLIRKYCQCSHFIVQLEANFEPWFQNVLGNLNK